MRVLRATALVGFLALSAAVLATSGCDSETPGTVSGLVTDLGGIPVAGAEVSLSPEAVVAVTDDTGAYLFAGVAVGVHTVTLMYTTVAEEVFVLSGQDITADIEWPRPGLYYVGFDLSVSPFNDPNVRQAINYAVDRYALVTEVNSTDSGLRLAAEGILPPTVTGYDETLVGYTHNTTLADSLLAQSGYDAAAPLDLTYHHNDAAGHAFMAAAIKADLEALAGIGTVTVVETDWETHLQNIDDGTATMWRQGWRLDTPNPAEYLRDLYRTGSSSNFGGYSDTVVDGLIAEALAADDSVVLIEKVRAAEQAILDDAPALFVYYYDPN